MAFNESNDACCSHSMNFYRPDAILDTQGGTVMNYCLADRCFT